MTTLERLALQRAEEQMQSDVWRREPRAESVRPVFKAEPAPGRCKVSGCHRLARALGMCDAHYRRAKAGKPLLTPLQIHREVVP